MEKIVVITGGSLGIGLSCVNKFHQNNYKIINLDIVKPEENKSIFLKTDLSNIKEIKESFLKIQKDFGKIDILISNAGMHSSGVFDEITEEEYDKVISINLKGTFFVVQEAIKLMKQHGGRIITLGSDQSFIAKPRSAIYGLTKAAISHFTKSIALDYSKYNIIANCVAPGTVDTPLYRNAMNNYCKRTGADIEIAHAEEESLQPINRIAKPEEIADFIYFLTTEASSFIQGATLSIDGGYTIQ
jgi:2-keto-3-deoxy-L-fuconate dehydrogenase